MKHYRKMVVAVVGVGILQLHYWTGFDMSPEAANIVEAIIQLGIVLGVWGVPND